ncbi:unnamed protein product [Rotaria sp. Silwood2]|nr:unnamed protein product [Rotaria sp. Silwood2]
MLTASSIEHLSLVDMKVDLKSLFAIIPTLRSFNSTVDYNQLINNIYQHPSVHLQQLSITFHGITFDKVERLLSSITCLTHFTLIANDVQKDMSNGYRWAQLLSTIKTFKFILTFHPNAFVRSVLDLSSFCTKFWLLEKKWYVTQDVCIDNCFWILYSNPYFLNWYPFYYIVGTFVTESTDPASTSFINVKKCCIFGQSISNTTLWRRCTHVSCLSVSPSILNQDHKCRYATMYLDLTKITWLCLDDTKTGKSIDTTIQLMDSLPSLRTLRVSVTILKLLLTQNWFNIANLSIVWGSDRLPKLLTVTETDSLCRSFNHIETLEFTRSFIDDVSQLLNNMMKTLSHVFIDHASSITQQDDQFISYEWLKRNTNLSNFGYSCDKNNNVHIWLY